MIFIVGFFDFKDGSAFFFDKKYVFLLQRGSRKYLLSKRKMILWVRNKM